ncbi:antiviral helicase [Multifurca ochricompacta]|uniref:Antiviral helicase n=1 Tax=Multifurca ochricompacta TaxID=376703 RepID=A0AAD4MDV9_9AGAM|nr:antiviral helicase [Multifurca ochricompacta]
MDERVAAKNSWQFSNLFEDPKLQQPLIYLGLNNIPLREQTHLEIEERLLLPKERLQDEWLSRYQVYWNEQVSIPSLLSLKPSSPSTSISFIRSGLNGHVIGYSEVVNPQIQTGLTSTSSDRLPAPGSSFVRGKSGYAPFWPGGLDAIVASANDSDSKSGVMDVKGLRNVPPGFKRGIRLPTEKNYPPTSLELYDLNGQEIEAESKLEVLSQVPPDPIQDQSTDTVIDHLLPATRVQLRSMSSTTKTIKRVPVQKRDWAHVVDVNKPMKNFHTLVPNLARKYPFELDTFQKEAVYHLELGDSVFVAAHTSAGKTVVAEYAIALAEKHMTRAIYTSPIKALSNQKFRDFKQTFSSNAVGILTGDVQINPEANCLIMTTEILRSMLYKGADLIRDVEFVIFDEVHYVNDAERGVVWEEVIIMLPDHVNIILLSATVPNAKEFADWVGRTKKKDIYVISTAKRPVPLEHYLYASREVYKIVDAGGNFITEGYKTAGEALRRKQDKEREAAGLPPLQRLGARAAAPQRGQRGGLAGRGGHRGVPAKPVPIHRGGGPSRSFHQVDHSLYIHLIGLLRKQNLLPVVVFTFSKKRCEQNAGTLTNLDLSSAVEKSEIHITIEKAVMRLKGSDKKLPQIGRMRDLLSRGIGVHHGGLLPLVKEVVEILFARGLVKVLFATETFAMGVNMPAKSVAFSGIRKHDGRNFREILPGEYTQMAGRAGRRGLDTTGTVIIVASDELPEQPTLQHMITGKPGKLASQFRLTYNMILNLLRVETLKVEEMIKRSFSENASQQLLPDQQKRILENEKTLSSLPKLDCETCLGDINRCYDLSAGIVDINQQLLRLASGHAKSFSTGRVVILRDGHFSWAIAVILKPAATREQIKSFFILSLVDSETKEGKNDMDIQAVPPRWPPSAQSIVIEAGVYEVAIVPVTSIALVTSRTIKIDVDAVMEHYSISSMQDGITQLGELAKEWANGDHIPEVYWARMRSFDFQELLNRRNTLVKRLEGLTCVSCNNFEEHYETLHVEQVLRSNIANLKLAISDQNLELVPDYEQRVEVLKELKFLEANSTVSLKGRVACEINSVNELVLTELILENTLAAYDPEEVVALLSSFVFQEKTEVQPIFPPRLEDGRDGLLAILERVALVQDRNKVASDEHRWSLNFGLMEAVYEWAKGMPFDQLTALTDVAEGTIVRVITRLDETCREVRDAARVIGDAGLMKKMEEAQMKIKRDIVFAASLYF